MEEYYITIDHHYIIDRGGDLLHINPHGNLLNVLSHGHIDVRFLKKIDKETVIEALKTVLNNLDLPKEINLLKHKL